MDVFMVCSSIQLLDWSSGLGRRCRMFSGVRSFGLVRCWVCGSCVVMFCSVCGVVGGGNSISHFLIGVGLNWYGCGDVHWDKSGVSLWVRC